MTQWRATCLFMLLIAAAPPHRAPAPAADGAGNRMVAFASIGPPRNAETPPESTARHCTADRRWCARLRLEEGASAWVIELAARGAPQRDYELTGVNDEEAAFTLWPHIVIEAGGAVLIGAQATRSTGYAGGGASATRLVLVRAAPGGGPLRQVLDMPLRGIKEIRACFGPRDTRNRRGACSDQYEFEARLTIDPATRAGPPHFLYATTARTYPGRRTLDSDSTAEPPLRRTDLRWATDPVCSYRRHVAPDARSGLYAPDRPLPACGDFLDF